MKAKCKYDPDIAYSLALQIYIHHGGMVHYGTQRGIIECDGVGKPIGFSTYVSLKDRVIIQRLGVLPKFRRLGYGTNLLNRFKRFRKPLETYINLRNLPAIKFLQVNGFKMADHGDLYITFRKEWAS